MSSYLAEHAGALADLAEAGTAVTFSHTTSTYTESTDATTAPVTATVAGYALRVKGNPITYAALNLVQSEAPTLLFAPSTYGQMPVLGSSVTWGGQSYTVRDVNPLAPNGTAILCKVVVAR